MLVRSILFIFIICGIQQSLMGQLSTTQTVYGRIINKYNKQPLSGALVFVDNVYPIVSAISGADGYFYLNKVPVGRQTLKVQRRAFNTYFTDNLLVRSTGYTYLDIELIPNPDNTQKNSILQEEIRENTPINPDHDITTRSFTPEEVERYPNSYNDPGRMALAFAGLQHHTDDRSDLVIHNLPSDGLNFRVGGIDIDHIYHFSEAGHIGGGISFLSLAVLNNSDISMGGWSPSMGAGFSGVIDLHLSKGNRLKREYSIGAGVLGLEFSMQGPIKKERSSFLLNYRYSTLGLLSQAGIHIVSPSSLLDFQDLSFTTSFKSKNNKSHLMVFGIGASSLQEDFLNQDSSSYDSTHALNIFPNRFGLLGAQYTRILGKTSYLDLSFGLNAFQHIDLLRLPLQNDSISRAKRELNLKYTLNSNFTTAINSKWQLKTGLLASALHYINIKYSQVTNTKLDTLINNESGIAPILQPYIQTTGRLNSKLKITTGLLGIYYGLNNSFAINPRLAVQYKLSRKSKLSASYGIYSKPLQASTYLFKYKNPVDDSYIDNMDLKLPSVHKAYLSYRHLLGFDMMVQLDLFYHRLFNVPVTNDSSHNYLFNELYRRSPNGLPLVSEGSGQNYGALLTFEKFFTRGYFLLCTGSLSQSTFKTFNNAAKSTRFNNLFTSTLMGAKEFTLRANRGIIQLGLRVTSNGGVRQGEIDYAASQQAGKVIYVSDNDPFASHGSIYFRPDLRFAWRVDRRKYSIITSLDIQNFINNLNDLYVRRYVDGQVTYSKQSGLIPIAKVLITF